MLKKISGFLVALGVAVGLMTLPSGAAVTDQPDDNDGFQNTCVIGSWVNTSTSIFVWSYGGGGSDPDGGIQSTSCQLQVFKTCRNNSTGVDTWHAWQTGPSIGPTFAYTENGMNLGCTPGNTIVEWGVRYTNIFDIQGDKWAWGSHWCNASWDWENEGC